MYDQFYGFTGRAFQLAPDPHFYFESGAHRKAMSYLSYGLAQGEGIIVITGETGTGKTMLVDHVLSSLDSSRLNAVKLVAAPGDGNALLAFVAGQFGMDHPEDAPGERLRGIEIFLRSAARKGRRTLLIVDEAHHMSLSTLEQLQLLSGLRLSEQPLLQIFLLGLPEFRQTLFHTPSLDALRQRVIATHHLDPMEADEVELYIFHRLGKVGWAGNPGFGADAFEQLYHHSKGVPRQLNALVTKVLLLGAMDDLSRINGQNVRDAVAEMEVDLLAADPAGSGAGASLADDRSAGIMAEIFDDDAQPQTRLEDQRAAQEIAELRGKVAALEVRVTEQDAALRRVIDVLIQWVEPQSSDKPVPVAEDIWVG